MEIIQQSVKISYVILKSLKVKSTTIMDSKSLFKIRYNFHILKDMELLVVCMATANFKNKVAFSFLQEINKKFREKYSKEEIQSARDFDMSAGFSDIYKSQIVISLLFLLEFL